MKKLIAWLKSAKWVAYTVIAAVVGVILLVLRFLFFGPKPDRPGRLPDVPEKLKEKVEKVQEEALQAKVESKVKAESDKKEIEVIMQIDDGKVRREKLAAKLKNL